MKPEDRDFDANETAVVVNVDSDVMRKLRSGEYTFFTTRITENIQTKLLDNIDGNLVMVTNKVPETYRGCYYYNDGVFPYVIKESLQSLVFHAGEEGCVTRIIGVGTKVGTRVNYQGPGKPIIEDPNGDSCVWEVVFEVVPYSREHRSYLMRWNPSFSSFTEANFKECLESKNSYDMFRLNWSIFEWQEARRGDTFYMMREGDEFAGIAFIGQFTSDPYPGDDWAGSTKRRMYVDMVSIYSLNLGEKPHASLKRLQQAIPEFDWAHGHSGVLLPEEVAKKLEKLFE